MLSMVCVCVRWPAWGNVLRKDIAIAFWRRGATRPRRLRALLISHASDLSNHLDDSDSENTRLCFLLVESSRIRLARTTSKAYAFTEALECSLALSASHVPAMIQGPLSPFISLISLSDSPTLESFIQSYRLSGRRLSEQCIRLMGAVG